MEGPEQTPGRGIEAAHVARRRRPVPPEIHHRRADHDDAAQDHRRRRHGVIVAVDRAAQTFGEIDPAIPAECRHRRSGFGVQHDHLRKRREHHDAFVVAIAPIGDATMQPPVVGGNAEPVLVDLGIEHPFGRAADGIDGGDLRQRGGGVEHSADHQRRRFVEIARADTRIGLPGCHVRRLPAPGDMQIPGIATVDLRQRRITRGGVGARIGRPFTLRERFG